MIKISPNNRLLQHMQFNCTDEPIAEYLDFLAGYSKYRKESIYVFLRDNGPTINIGPFIVSRFKQHPLILKVSYYYQSRIIEICQLKTMLIQNQEVLKVDFYGKGLLILNRDNLRDEAERLLQHFGLYQLTLTRLDYAIDCRKMNFDKKNKLKTKNNFTIKNDRTGDITYRLFGNKRTSAMFIRYYDKKLDLAETEFERLYPEYQKEKIVMRYELQIQSDGIHQDDKIKRVDELKYIAHLGQFFDKNTRNHHKYNQSSQDLIFIKDAIKRLGKEQNLRELSKIQRELTKYLPLN